MCGGQEESPLNTFGNRHGKKEMKPALKGGSGSRFDTPQGVSTTTIANITRQVLKWKP